VRVKTRGSAALLIVMLTVITTVACTQPGGGGGATAGHRQITYGPFTVPAANGTRMGMITNQFRLNVAKPCTNCYITGMRAGLIDASGRSVNVNTGQWLHHMVLLNSGATSIGCAGHLGGEWFFASGNERTPLDLTRSGSYGYPVRSTETWQLIADLMNMATVPATVRITMDFDFVPMSTPGLRPARPIWIDAGCLSASEVPVPAGRTTFDVSAQWTMAQPAKLLYIHGHMHDGGTHMDITANGREICDSQMHYGETPEYVEGGMDHSMPGMDMGGMGHISSVSLCQGTTTAPVAQFSAGTVVRLVGHYDANAHPLMKNGNSYEGVMGIAHGWMDMS
jgi:hypothetical protein